MTEQSDDLLTIRDVCVFFGGTSKPLDQATIYRWVAAGKLAQPIRMTARTMRWRRSDCLKAMETMAQRAKS